MINLNSNLTSELLQSQKFWGYWKEGRAGQLSGWPQWSLLLVFTIYNRDGRLSELTMTAHLGHRLLSRDWGDHSHGAMQGLWFTSAWGQNMARVRCYHFLTHKDSASAAGRNLSFLPALVEASGHRKGSVHVAVNWKCSLGPAAQGEPSPENHHTNAASWKWMLTVVRCLWPWLTERLPPLKGPEPEPGPGFHSKRRWHNKVYHFKLLSLSTLKSTKEVPRTKGALKVHLDYACDPWLNIS